MTILDINFKKKGFSYHQKLRQNNLAIYYVYDSIHDQPSCYEVIKIKSGISPFSKTQEEKEFYPGTSSWGVLGWTYHTFENALKKFEELLNNQIQKAKHENSK